ncbi:lipopolysaccharide biosynthesis protein [Pedobacter sp. SYSU D00535]|uniref:lipopolysaccharide biosynthesis protein n=1 Tax=Pedobacter sp. SYSU D00535 TaxID=2810308 RepID=UPI001A95CB7F|nr:MATE family efflux transporter [Pedobacter sp. SYSU D00535]
MTADEVGFISTLLILSQIIAHFSLLGFANTGKFFPKFNVTEGMQHTFLFLSSFIALTGYTCIGTAVFLFRDVILTGQGEDSNLLSDYFNFLFPLSFVFLLYNIIELYGQMVQDIVTGRLFREFLRRILILFSILLLFFKVIPFEGFMLVWLVGNAIPAVIVLYKININWSHFWKPDFKSLGRAVKRELWLVSLLGLLTGAIPLFIQTASVFLVKQYFGLADVGVLTVALNFAAIIALPGRSLYSIAYSVVASKWAENNLDAIESIYRKSSLNLFLITLLLFVITYANIDNILALIGKEFSNGEEVILIAAFGNLINAVCGINGTILNTSKYVKLDSYFQLFIAGFCVLLSFVLIPLYQLHGAAVSICCMFILLNIYRLSFIYIKLNMHPFSNSTLVTLAIGLTGLFFCHLIPERMNPTVDFLLRTTFICCYYVFFCYCFKVSEDINLYLKKVVDFVKKTSKVCSASE